MSTIFSGTSRRGPNRHSLGAALAGLAVLTALLPAAPAAGDHTAVPQAVTLVGSLQEELGCPGDWQPECAATHLQPVDGQPGVFRGTFDVPAGGYDYKVALNDAWTENYGADGSPGGANIPLTAPGGQVTFTYDHGTHRIVDDSPKPLVDGAAAQWLRRDTIAWDLPEPNESRSYRLYWAEEGGLTRDDGRITGGESAPLRVRAGGLPADLRAQYPHLASYDALTVPDGIALRRVLTGQVAIASVAPDGTVETVTGLQLPGVLDDLYAAARTRALGPTWHRGRPAFALWAPTARSVDLLLTPQRSSSERSVPMTRTADGTWTVRGRRAWRDARYRFAVRVYVPNEQKVVTNLVTDPYSLGLTTNSQRSILVDLEHPALKPKGWDRLPKPSVGPPEESSIYELHVRDFSIGDRTVPARHRGTYLAFTDRDSDGMRHLRRLARAGLNTVHLLPVNDIASIEEDRSVQQDPRCDLASYPPDSEEQQECVTEVAANDGFNWGYDPWHYTAPEGSYATDPSGTARNKQFREMVKGINGAGQRVVMDVVYNHTPASGQDPKSVLDRVVPGYYQRLNATGQVETSTCCSNTATEHAMMEKLMIDSVLTWTREYKVDGFRFDLMGHQPKAAMLRLRAALDRLTVRRDGVNGRRILLYGEGWNFGEVADNARFVQATQREMAGTGIATFNDRLRDAVRGGGPFDEDPRVQGFASGQFTDPNGAATNGSPAAQRQALLLNQDRIRVGLTGNLKDYRFTDRTGAVVTGADVDYNGQPTGYTRDPQEAVTYVEAHDNETLFDALAFKLPQDTSMSDRIRMQTLALSTTAFSQGISFWHAGGDLLRSKSLDRNSYDSGDWFNLLDLSRRTNGFGRGLPPRPDNEAKWDFMRPLLADPALVPTRRDIATASRRADELLAIRAGTRLFHLGTAPRVQRKLSFPNGGPAQTPGVIVMRIDDRVGPGIDRRFDGLVVVFNASPDKTTQSVAGTAGQHFRLHPVQAHGSDATVRRSRYDGRAGSFTVPARSVAVFVAR